MRFRNLTLRPLRDTDIELAVKWSSDADSLKYWISNRAIADDSTTTNEFWRQIRSGDKHVLLIAENDSGEIVGMIYSYNPQFVDQNCFITVYVDSKFRGRGYGAIMMALFIDYLFTYFSFRKIYLDVYEYNNASVDPVKNFSFQLEGVFGEHRYFDGKWHTMNRYALYRTEIDRVRQFLARG
jgi:RimJ/RimL family protein N-acetyltransferase